MNLADMFDVKGYGVIVTGGASGLGLAFVEVLAEHGARVSILDCNRERIERVVPRLTNLGGDVRGAVVDVTEREQLDAAFDEAVSLYGRLDVVFANAGVDAGPGFVDLADRKSRPAQYAIENYEDARWNSAIRANLDSVFFAIKASARHMKPRNAGRIIVTTSTAAIRTAPGVGAAYMAAKAAAAHLVRNTALELARYNILVNAIAPGPFITNIGGGHAHKPEVQASFARRVPLQRMAHTDEVKGLALLLASPASSFITGAEFLIDGGFALGMVE
jgi:NAD(P)-dependent dehydrogenase (short-subunit alcohol dehydrogenase family)